MHVPHFVLPISYPRRALVVLFSLLLYGVVSVPAPLRGQEALIAIAFGPVVEVIQGAPAIVTLTVSGSMPLINVAVASTCDVGPTRVEGDVNRNLVLEPGERWQYHCEISRPTQTFNQFATVIAQKQRDQSPVSASTAVRIVVLNLGIHLEKQLTAPVTPILQGQTVTFTLTLRNTGNAAIAHNAITLIDPLCASGPQLQPEAGVTDDNELDADPDGNLSNGIAGEVWHYACVVPAVLDNFTNTAQVQALDRSGRSFAHSAQAAVTVLNPGLAVIQAVYPTQVNAGAPLTWTTRLFNTGEVAFHAVQVHTNNPFCPPIGPLEPGTPSPAPEGDTNNNGLWESGEIWSFHCVHPFAPDVTRPLRTEVVTAAVTALTTLGDALFQAQSPPTAVQVVTVRGVAITQTAPPQPIFRSQDITIPITVTNTGSVDLVDLQVRAPLCNDGPTFITGDDNADGRLNPDDPATLPLDGEQWRYTCQLANLQQSFTQVATVMARDTISNPVAPAADWLAVAVVGPDLNLTKHISETTIWQGATATAELAVTHYGAGELMDVTVSDPQCDFGVVVGPFFLPDAPNDQDDRLDPGEIWHYRCTTANVREGFVNSALVTARDALSNVLQTSATATVAVQTPGLGLTQSPAFQLIQAGEPVSFTIQIENQSATPLTPLTDRATGGLYVDGLYAPLCTTLFQSPAPATPGVLMPGTSWYYHCTVDSALTQDSHALVNPVAVAFQDSAGQRLSARTAAAVQILQPVLHLEKLADPVVAPVGGQVTLRYVVRNRGASPLTAVTVTDPACPTPLLPLPNSDRNNDNRLDPSERWAYACPALTVAADWRDTVATATAAQATGAPVSDQAVAPVTLWLPDITLAKSTQTPLAPPGAPVLFTIQATNNYLVNLLDVQVTDPQCQADALALLGGDTNGDGKLSPTESWRYACVVTAPEQRFTNTVTMTGRLEYNITTITRTATTTISVVAPALTLQKTAASPAVTAGRAVTFTLRAANPGASDLVAVQVADPQCDEAPLYREGDQNSDQRLNPGESWQYTCVVREVQVDFTNTATVTAATPAGRPLQAGATADVIVRRPALALVQTPVTQTLAVGQAAAFTLTVTNPGNQALAAVQLVSPACPDLLTPAHGDTNGDTLLDQTETWVYHCSIAAVQQSWINTATVTALDPDLTPVQATTSATVTVGAIGMALLQTPLTQTVPTSQTAHFTLTLQNRGDLALTAVTLVDPACHEPPALAEGDRNQDAQLDPTESWLYHCQSAPVHADFTNVATATAQGPQMAVISATALATVTVVAPCAEPAITLTKEPPQQTVTIGGTATFTLQVASGCQQALTALQLSDPGCTSAPALVSGDGNQNAQLDGNERWLYGCTAQGIEKAFTNRATVQAQTADKTPVRAQARAKVKVHTSSAIELVTPDALAVGAGMTTTLAVLVTNPGAEPLYAITASHDSCTDGALRYQSGDQNHDDRLDAGESWRYTCTIALAPQAEGPNGATPPEQEGMTTVTAHTAANVVVQASATTTLVLTPAGAPEQHNYLPMIRQ